ncbi:uncharacterized protein LOC109847283 [Asparagus officinalis]|uniref:uncharacterized protein LOC109847283 n=1 Tax=Asparagus officinalis TaxID=4686 RepID=UPI00098E860F|nr:uncharacterized protein LOC109847283 [Asparagus officinalis]
MVEVASLFSLCIKSISAQIINGCDGAEELFELPSHFLDGFLDGLLMELPPLALQKLHELFILVCVLADQIAGVGENSWQTTPRMDDTFIIIHINYNCCQA